MKRIALGMGLSDYYDHGIARGVVRYAKTRPGWQLHGYGCMFSPLESLSKWHGDGVIARIEYAEDAQVVTGLSCPVVDVANAFPVSNAVSVANDDFQTGSMAGRFFSENGFSTFAYCGVSDVRWSASRREGFLAQSGKRAVSVFERPLRWWLDEEYSMELELFLSRLAKPVALFACNDKAGLRVSSTCAHQGFSVPDEVAILGVDNEDIPCELANPTLSSIQLQLEELGRLAAARLDAMMSDQSAGVERVASSEIHQPGQLQVSPGNVVERKSTSAYVSTNPIVVDVFRRIRSDQGHLKSVSDLVRELPVGRRSIEMQFKRETGHTIHEAIVSQRIKIATQLLRTTDHTVEAIAEDAGFGSLQRFFSNFRDHVGTTPARFRRRCR